MRLRWRTGFVVISAIILAASFLPWASLPSVNPAIAPLETQPPNLGVAVGAFSDSTRVITGWQGQFVFGPYPLPNEIVALGALLIPAVEHRPKLAFVVALIPLIHLLVFGVAMRLSSAALGIGYIVTLMAYVVILILLIKRIGMRQRRS